MHYNYKFSSLFKKANILSLIVFFISLILISFKGLNFGIDFKGGTLIELRIVNKDVKIADIRNTLRNLNLGDINVKEFGKKGDYLIKIEETKKDQKNFILNLILKKIYKLI
jgi:preprotein translocase subunit SecF